MSESELLKCNDEDMRHNSRGIFLPDKEVKKAGAACTNERLKLTPRESEIVNLLSQGKVIKQVGAKLKVSRATVVKHLSNITDKATAGGYVWARVLVKNG